VNPPIRFVTTDDGVRIACAAHGDGRPLIFVRGWISHLELAWDDPAFRAYFEAIGRQLRVVRFDMRGNGLSDRDVPPVGLDEMQADISAVMDEYAPLPAVIYAQCWGGPAAIAWAAAHPDRVSHLILDGTFADGARITNAERRERIVQTLRELPEAGLLLMAHYTQPNLNKPRFGQIDQSGTCVHPAMAAQLYAAGFTWDVSTLLEKLTMPVLVLHRRNTQAIPMRLGREIASSVPGARFVALNGTAHNPWEEDPEEALGAIGEFLGVQLLRQESPQGRIAGDEGLLTILYTDMEESTRMTRALGDDRAQAVRREHDAIIRQALRAHGGNEVKHTGDGVMATFTSAARALQCAIAIQRALAVRNDLSEQTVRVRIGINAGEPVAEAGDIFGTAVIAASRVMEQAGGDEILVSNVVRELCAGKGFQFIDRGMVELKGFDEAVRLFQVGW